jgi:hypothetical protein
LVILAYDNSAITVPAYALNEMLRLYAPSVQSRVYPPGLKEDARMPRITITALTPREERVGIGERFGSYMGLWYFYTFRVDVWDKDPNQVEKVSNEVMYSIWKNRNYTPASPRDVYGQFVNLEISGGSATAINAAKQLYQRTLNITGRWLSKSQELW